MHCAAARIDELAVWCVASIVELSRQLTERPAADSPKPNRSALARHRNKRSLGLLSKHHPTGQLYDALARLPPQSENGDWYRSVNPKYIATALSTAHTKVTASRFNPGNLHAVDEQFESLYLVEDPITAMFESGAMLGRPDVPGGHVPHPQLVMIVLRVNVVLQHILDLFDETNAEEIEFSTQELTGDWKHYAPRVAPTQALGEAIFRMGLEGFLARSPAIPSRKILVIFPQNLEKGSKIVWHDPTGQAVHMVSS